MANQPLAFGELLTGGILLTAALTGSSVREVVAGKAGPFRGFSIGSTLAGTPTEPGQQGQVANAVVGSPLAGVPPHKATHETSGLAGYPAYDYMAPAGTDVLAPVSGTITRLSGHDPAAGPTNGPHGPFGLSVYLRGDDGKLYYLTHLGSLFVKTGQRVTQGSIIATIGNYAKWGGADHVHVGVHG